MPKNTPVLMDLLGFNTSKEVWGEDALEWRPERWLEPLPGTVEDIRVPGVYANLYVLPTSDACPVLNCGSQTA